MSLILVQFSMIWPSWQASLSREGLRSGKSDSLSYGPPLFSSDAHKASHARRACLLMGRCRFIVDSLLIRTSTVSQFRQPCSRFTFFTEVWNLRVQLWKQWWYSSDFLRLQYYVRLFQLYFDGILPFVYHYNLFQWRMRWARMLLV